MSTVILLAIYLVVTIAAQAYAGVESLVDDTRNDVLSALGYRVFGSPLDKLLIIVVLTSAAASTQTTILPTASTTLSMAAFSAIPSPSAGSTPAILTPDVSTSRWGRPRSSGTSDHRQRRHPLRLDRLRSA